MTTETHTTDPTDPTATAQDAPTGTADAPDLPDDVAAIAPTARKPRGVKSFADVGVDADLVAALTAKGFEAPFPIQELTLPLATKGHDVIGQARTGTGKTLAFGLALLSRVTPGGGTQALVIVPTRELCIQVADEMQIGKARGLRTIAVYGGVGYEEQEAAFREGHEIVVGTPGRLLDHLNKGNLKLDGVRELVLDEADEMLDMGFLPDVERLIEACASDRHGMLFSATMPTEVVRLARRYLDHPTFMRADTEVVQTAPNVTQHFFQVHRMDKPRVLARILQSPDRGGVYVFVRTKHMADRLVRELEELSTPAIAIHGDLRQATREKNLDKFRDGSATVLVATEVAARGLDVDNVTHVVNYDCPDDEKMYLHRIGRTARAGAKGVAVTFAEFNEIDRLNVVRKKLGATDNAIVPVFSPSEIITERFDLPATRPWDEQVAGSKAGTRTDRRAPADDDRGGKGRGKGRGGEGRGGEGRGGRGGRDDRTGGRTGSSDGRPKSTRSAEGTGNDRDADRSRRDRASRDTTDRDARTERDARPERDASAERGSAGTADAGTSTDRDATRDRSSRDRGGRDRGGDRTSSRRDGDRDRGASRRGDRDAARGEDAAPQEATSRRRTRATAEDASGDDRSAPRRDDRSAPRRDDDRARTRTRERAASSDAAPRTRARVRARDTGTATEGRGDAGREDDGRGRRGRDGGGRERGDGSSRQRSDRERGEGRARDGDGGRGRGGRSEGEDRGRGGRSEGEGRARGGRGDDGGRGRDGRGSRDGGGRGGRSRAGRDGRGRDDRGGRGDRGRDDRGGRGDRGRDERSRGGRQDDPTVTTAGRGEEARGDGSPALARRVKVEHLP